MVELYRTRPFGWIVGFTVDWVLIIGAFWFLNMVPALFSPFFIFFIGTRLHSLALLAHDSAHKLVSKEAILNDFLAETMVAWPLGVVINHGYRPWHFDHHRLLGTVKDPELEYRNLAPYLGRPTWKKIGIQFVKDLCGLGTLDLFRFMKAIFPRKKPIMLLGPLLVWSVFFVVCFRLNCLWIFFTWIASIVCGFWPVFRIRTWMEHIGVGRDGRENTHRFSTNWLVRFLFFPHNTHCHYEHHKYSQVPYYNLPELRKKVIGPPIVPLRSLFPFS